MVHIVSIRLIGHFVSLLLWGGYKFGLGPFRYRVQFGLCRFMYGQIGLGLGKDLGSISVRVTSSHFTSD